MAMAVPATATASTLSRSNSQSDATLPGTDPINLTVVPFEDCITANKDGSTTAYFGYYSFASSTTVIKKGTANSIKPSTLDGAEPTSFQSGLSQRAFQLVIPKGVVATWTLNGFPANAPNAGAPICSQGDLSVVGFVSCTRLNKDGSTSALMGYYNSSNNKVTIPKGQYNIITPAKYDGPEPTTFQSGLNQGAFSLTVAKNEIATWTVSGFPAIVPNSYSSTCPASIVLPQEGNGLGLVVGLILAGIIGALGIRRIVNRAGATT